MDKKTVFVKTDKGESEVAGRSDALFGDVKRILSLVDDESTVAEITKRAPPSLRDALQNMLQELVDGGYIRDMREPVNVPSKPALKMSTPAFKMATPKAPPPSPVAPPVHTPAAPSIAPAPASSNVTPAAKPAMTMPDMMMPTMPAPSQSPQVEQSKSNGKSDLDFSFITGAASASPSVDQAAKDRAQIEATIKAKQEAGQQAALQEAVAKAAKLKAYEEAKVKAKIEVEARARIEAETKAKNAAEAARLKAEQEAQRSRATLESARIKMEAEMRARIEAEARAKQAIEAAKLKAEQDAEKLRLELEAAKAKAEAEFRNRIEAEARVKAEVEARIKREAEAEKLKLEKERAELEAARVRAEAEARSRIETEARVKAEVEAKMQQEAAAEKLRLEREKFEIEAAKAKVEAEIRMRLDAEEKAKAAVDAKIKADADAEIKSRIEAEARIRAEVEERLKAETIAKEQALRAAANPVKPAAPVKEAFVDPGEKLRQSFVESFGQASKPKQDPSSTAGFKLDNFSLLDTGKMPAASPSQANPKAEVPGTGGSKVKAALEQRAQKEAEEKRLKAEQEAARVKAQQDEAARIKAEQDAVRLAAEREAYRKQAEENEARAKAEAETQKLSSQQSKQWEEAQQRAAIHEQAEKERLAKQAQLNSQQKSSRGPRKPLPLGKITAGLFALMLLAIFGLPYVLPMEEYIAPLEKEISEQINQPVKINKIHVTVLPLPKLDIDSLVVGSGNELAFKSAVLHFDFSALFSATKLINKLELNEVNLAGASLDKSLDWLRMMGASEKYPVSRMEFRGIRVNTSEVKLPLLNGKADFDTQGKFIKAELKSEDEKFALEFEPLQNHLQLAVNLRDTNLPIFTNVKFTDFSTTGIIENGEYIISDVFAHIHGGSLTGKAKLGWFNGWKLDAQLKSKNMELQSLFSSYGITGQLYGDVNVTMYAPTLSQLDKDARMEGSFEAKDGVINKLDIDTIARFGTRQGGIGRTNFTEINGTVKADSRGYKFYMSKIAAGSVNGSGLFEVDSNQGLTGRLLMDIKGDTRNAVTMQLSGTPTDPSLQVGR